MDGREGGPPREPPRDGEDPSTAVQVGRYTGHGLTLAVSTALFTWAGNWLDERLGTAPVLVIVGAFVGFGAGFYSMYRQLVSPPSDSEAEARDRTPGGQAPEPGRPEEGRSGRNGPPDPGSEAPRNSAGPG